MCMIESADERVLLLSDSDMKAKKPHKCGECGREIQAKEIYHRETGVFEGRLECYKTCKHCMVARHWLSEQCGGWLFGGILEDLIEHADECFDVRLNRLIVGMKRKWKRFDGTGLINPVQAK